MFELDIQLKEFIKNLENFRNEINNIDYTHDRNKYFSLILNLREFLAKEKSKELFNA